MRDGLRLRLETVPGLAVIGEAGNAAAALAFLRGCLAEPDGGTLPHLALMDLNMPGVGGLELAAQLHERYPQIAVLVLSMHDNPEYMLQAVRAARATSRTSRRRKSSPPSTPSWPQLFQRRRRRAAVAGQRPRHPADQRERDVLRHIAEGHANKQIAQALNLSVRTVETHRLNIKRKLGIDGQAELISTRSRTGCFENNRPRRPLALG